MLITETIGLAWSSVRGNMLRSVLTLLSISIGVFAIMASTTVVDSLSSVLEQQLSQLGSNTFIVTKQPAFMLSMKDWRKYRKRKDISWYDAQLVREQATTARNVTSMIQSTSIVKGNGEATDGVQQINGCDEQYTDIFNFAIQSGRSLTFEDVQYKRDVAVIGADLVQRLFHDLDPVGKSITIGPRTFTVIGTLERKGSVIGQSQDGLVIIPITAHMKYFSSRWDNSLTLTVKAKSNSSLEETEDQVIGILRIARKVAPGDDNDFELLTNDSIMESFSGFKQYIVYFSAGVGALCLLAAGVGIMNIMLVSVKERTREIGVRKAVGATRANILLQFVVESVALCQFGGVIGILMGVIGGNVLAYFLHTSIVFPLMGTLIAVGACTVIGVAFGAYPAWRASKLDPIDALRYE